MRKKILSILLALCMVFALLPFGALADEYEGNFMYTVKNGAATVTGYRVRIEGTLEIPAKLGGVPVRSIGTDAFREDKGLTEIVLPEGLTRIGVGAFYASGLEKINIPKSLKEVGALAFDYTPLIRDEQYWEDDVFYFGCNALKVRGYRNSYTIRPGTAYLNCAFPDSITSVTLPEGLLRIGYGAMDHAPGLKSIKLPDSLEYIGGECFIRSGLTEIIIPPHVKTIGDSAFSGCQLQKITLTGNELEKIGGYAFYDNPLRMDTLKIPNSVTSIGLYAFAGGIYKELILGSGLTKLEEGSFSGSSWLQTLRIPASIQVIGDGALQGRLYENPNYPEYTTKVYYEGTENEWKQVQIKAHNEPLKTMKVQCKAEPCVEPFTDVLVSKFYAEPVLWAVNHDPQITNGTSPTTFSPEATCTRGQVVTFLWRAAGCPEPTSTKNPFKDVSKDAYYYKAVLWAVENGITNGTGENTFSPGNPCTRGQVVTFLSRSFGSQKVDAKNPFKDVKSGAYYYDAVLWAVKNEITNGTSETTFSPDQTCTRGQIVTFLYRAFVHN